FAEVLQIAPTEPEMQALLLPRYWDGSKWSETVISLPEGTVPEGA
ncbi:MAG: hypothetical protein DRJ65_21485, partial [Acidobacteria bacterium]